MTTAARAVFTGAAHGDLAVGGEPGPLGARRASIHPAPWTWLTQCHGADVVTVTAPGDSAGAAADAAVTTAIDTPIAVHTADCAPLLLTGPGTVGVVHAGWRGLVAGVVESTIERMGEIGSLPTSARLGPCIRARCYEFGEDDLGIVEARYGSVVRSTTARGTTALDLAAALAAACRPFGLEIEDSGVCTACSPVHWSHRARGDRGRQALVAWLERDATDVGSDPTDSGG